MEAKFSELIGMTLVAISGLKKESEEIVFLCDDGIKFRMYHEQDCCESVSVEDICGDISCLIGSPILQAEESKNPDGVLLEYQKSFTWTFYKLATVRGYVTIRWYGESNGYYSESVDFEKVTA